MSFKNKQKAFTTQYLLSVGQQIICALELYLLALYFVICRDQPVLHIFIG